MTRTVVAPVTLGLLGLCWSLTAANPLPSARDTVAEGESATKPDSDVIERCSDGWSFDATTLDHNGTMLFFKEEFPGIPYPLDAAVECHHGECPSEGVLFFQGNRKWFWDFATRTKKERSWPAVGNCTAALRWLERYYCFQGNQFLRFNPISGEVPPRYPLDARDYFMSCPGRGHGRPRNATNSTHPMHSRCSPDPGLTALMSDHRGATYAFTGSHYWRLDTSRDGWHSWPIAHHWPQGPSAVDAAFSWDEKVYLIQGTQVYVFLTKGGNTLVSGYPKRLEKELGSPPGISLDTVDSTFTCPGSSRLYVTAGRRLWWLDLKSGAQAIWTELSWPHEKIDGALCLDKSLGPNSCSSKGPSLYLIHGPNLYCYSSIDKLNAAKVVPQPQKVNSLFGCSQ
ncbi:Hpx [Lemmus lemmus]